MRTIHCPKDLGFKNTFSDEDCESEQYYNNCYHCWSTALAKDKDFINEELIRWFAIAELKKVKTEIEEKQSKYTDRWVMGVTDYPYGCYRGYEETIKLIDKHIYELKGDK